MRWACGESTKDEVDIQSVESAICLSEWIEKSFQRVMAEITSANMPGDLQSQKILSELPNEFFLCKKLNYLYFNKSNTLMLLAVIVLTPSMFLADITTFVFFSGTIINVFPLSKFFICLKQKSKNSIFGF